MTETRKSQVDTSKLLNHLSRVVLRMLPILPGPELYDLVKDLSRSRTELDEKITRAQTSLSETSTLVKELESGLNDRVEKLQRLKLEYKKYSELVEVEEGKAKPIIQQIETAIGRNRGKERLIALGLNLLAGIIVFLLGVGFGPPLTKWAGITQDRSPNKAIQATSETAPSAVSEAPDR